MNALVIGTTDKTKSFIDLAPKSGFLWVHDDFEYPLAHDVLDVSYRFNILRAATDHDRFARDFISILDNIFPYGATTLTRGTENYLLLNCLRLLLLDDRATLLDIQKVIKDKAYRTSLKDRCDDPVIKDNWAFIETWDAKDYRPLLQKISGLLASPLIRSVLCAPKTTFEIDPSRRTILKLDRAAIGDFAAFLIGSLLIGQYKGQVVVPDFGFYGREMHTALVREERLIAGANALGEFPVKLRQALLGIKTKIAYRVTAEDAASLLPYFPKQTKISHFTELSDQEYIFSHAKCTL